MIPVTMQALVLTSPGEFEIREVPVPKVEPGEVLCKVRVVAICGSDPEIIHGGLAGTWPPSYPFIPGHEWAGEVVSVGKGVTNLKIGDRVAGEAHKGCGFCPNCLTGLYNLCLNYGKPESGHKHYGFVSYGAFAQYNAYSVRSVTKMPENVSFNEGALVDTAGVALHGLELSGITPGGTVCIIGPGPIGMIAMRAARALGTSRVIAVGRGTRLEFAKKLGADLTINFMEEDPVKAVLNATDGLGVGEVFECSGAEGTFNQAVRMASRGGKVVLLGVPSASVQEKIPFKRIVHDEIVIFGSRANPNVSNKVLAWLSSGNLVVKDLITHRLPLEQFAKALDIFETRREGAIKVVVEPNGSEDEQTVQNIYLQGATRIG